MSYIAFSCGSCNQDLTAPLDMAGSDVSCPTCEKTLQVPSVPLREEYLAQKSSGSLFARIVAGAVAGIILSAISGNIFTLLFGDPMVKDPSDVFKAITVLFGLGVWVLSIIIAVKSLSAAKAWRRLLIPSGILTFFIPLATLVATAKMATLAAEKGGQMADLEAGVYAASGTVASVIAGFFSVILGAIFLTIGLLVGKDAKK